MRGYGVSPRTPGSVLPASPHALTQAFPRVLTEPVAALWH